MNRLPETVQLIADAAISAFQREGTGSDLLTEIYEWLEVDGWDELIAGDNEQMAVDLKDAQILFDDRELRKELDVPAGKPITDNERVSWARTQLQSRLDDEWITQLSIHTFPIFASDGSTAVIGCLIGIHGQGGPECEWQGLFATKDDFLSHLKARHYWITPLMGEIPDDVILKLWQDAR